MLHSNRFWQPNLLHTCPDITTIVHLCSNLRCQTRSGLVCLNLVAEAAGKLGDVYHMAARSSDAETWCIEPSREN